MRKSLILFGFVLFIVGVVLGFYASQRNCLIAFIREGYMSFWTAIELLGGLIALAGIVIILLSIIKKSKLITFSTEGRRRTLLLRLCL